MVSKITPNIVYELAGRLSPALQTPVFIIGSGRCGTTLLVRVLNSHSELLGFPGEANDLWHPLSYPYRKKQIETPAILEEPSKFTELSKAHWPKGHGRKIQNVFAGFRTLKGPKKFFFSKSAMISFMIPTILKLFPDAKFLHLYRNGPSVVASLVKKEWDKYSDYFKDEAAYKLSCALYWKACIEEIEARKDELSLEANNAYYECSYEMLCDDPRTTMQEVARFIGIAQDGFDFDFSQISNKNFKVGDYKSDKSWIPLLDTMSTAMKMKGYDV